MAKVAQAPRPKSIEALGSDPGNATRDTLGRSYYLHCLETAMYAVAQARVLVAGDPVETNHELPLIMQLLVEAYEAS